MTVPIYAGFRNLKNQRMVERRYNKWMKEHWWSDAKDKFIWTDENVKRLFALNDAIIEKENSLYKLLSDVKADIESLLAAGKSYYEYYDIEAYLSYEADEYATPSGDENTMFEVYRCTNFQICMGLSTMAGRPLESIEEEFSRELNWNIEFFQDIPDREHYISRSLHWLVEQRTYTMEDLLYLNPDYFVECIQIRN